MKLDKFHYIPYIHIHLPMTGQLTMSRTFLYQIRVCILLLKVNALEKTSYNGCVSTKIVPESYGRDHEEVSFSLFINIPCAISIYISTYTNLQNVKIYLKIISTRNAQVKK